MTTALMNQTAALPTAAAPALANPLAGVSGRVKRLDPNELIAVAQEIMTQQNNAAEYYAGVNANSGTQANPGVAQAEEYLAQLQAQQQALVEQQQLRAANTAAPTSAPAATAPVATAPAATDTASTQQETQVSAAQSSGAVNVPSSPIAPRTEHDYWTKHIAQFKGKYLPDGPEMRPNCGPASVTMALRMIGLDIPGFSGQNSEAVLDQARILATGKNDVSVGTTDSELETLINKSGGQWSESNNFNEITGWVKQGIPVVLSGNPAYGWNHRYNADDVQPFDGGHWVTVSGYDEATGYFIVNDPLSQIGPIFVSEAELRSYNQAHGNLGIAVFR